MGEDRSRGEEEITLAPNSHNLLMARHHTLILCDLLAAAVLLLSITPARSAGTWGPLGSGLAGTQVDYLQVWNGKLIAAGRITTAGGLPAHNIAAWDGSQWSALGEGWDSIRGITTHNGMLAVAGVRPDSSEGEVALWDGVEWTTAAKSNKNLLASYLGQLYQADQWRDALGYHHASVKRYDGLFWVTVREWVLSPGYGASINVLTVIDDSLFVDVGPYGWIYSYDGSTWTPKGTTGREFGKALTKANGTLYSLGRWNIGETGVSFWDGALWTDILFQDYFTDDLFAGADKGLIAFEGKATLGSAFYDGVNLFYRVVQWDGLNWTTLGGEMNNLVRVLTIYNGKLMAAGEFTEADSLPAGFVAEYLGPVTPVAISSFLLNRVGEGVRLSWRITADELFDGFHIYRSDAGGSEVRVTSSILPASARSFVDRSAEAGHRYSYVLVAVGVDGGQVRSQSAEIELPALVAELRQNSPNPFNPSTTIGFVVPESDRVTIEVFGPSGLKVRTLVSRTYAPGEWSTTWDGADEQGNPVASGVYYYRMRIGNATQAKKMVLLK